VIFEDLIATPLLLKKAPLTPSTSGEELRKMSAWRHRLAPHEREDAERERHLEVGLDETRLDRVCGHSRPFDAAGQLISEQDVVAVGNASLAGFAYFLIAAPATVAGSVIGRRRRKETSVPSLTN
jgi:hypothetical protein